MKRTAITLGMLTLFMAPLFTMAHPGHGESEGYTIIHYFTEPMHAIITLGSLVTVAVVVYFSRRKNSHSEK